jgi:hypothetical protein
MERIRMLDWEWIKNNKFHIVNLVGSISSIVAFAILMLSIVSSGNKKPAEILVWQYTFFIMSIVGISAAIVFTALWIMAGNKKQRSVPFGVIIATSKIFIGLVLVGIGFDALICAVNWTVMFYAPFRAIMRYPD